MKMILPQSNLVRILNNVDEANTGSTIYLEETGQQVGQINFYNNEATGEPEAKIQFVSDPKDPKGQFNYEPDSLNVVTVNFEGWFKATKTEAATPPTEDDVIQILDKTFPLPEHKQTDVVDFAKSGTQIDTNTIEWTVEIKRTTNGKSGDLSGFVLQDELANVGQYVDGSFTVTANGKDLGADVEAAAFADPKNMNSINFTFPENTLSPAVVKFRTTIDWADNEDAKTVSNSATLTDTNNKTVEKDAEVPVNRKPYISKNFMKVEVDTDSQEKSLLWTIEVGKEGFNYGPAWVIDILNSNVDNMPKPKRTTASVQRKVAGEKWEDVELAANPDPKNSPYYPGQDQACPDISEQFRTHEIYDFGSDFQDGVITTTNTTDVSSETSTATTTETETPETPAKTYKMLDNHWYFIPELSNVYRIVVKQTFAMNTLIQPESLQNDAQINVCGSINKPIKPSPYTGLGKISKTALDKPGSEGDYEIIRKGHIKWNIDVDLSGALPNDPQYAYDFLYYNDKADYEQNKANLTVDETAAQLPEGTFAVINSENLVSVDQAYVEDSFKNENDSNLTVKVFPVMNGAQRVGDLLQFAGFTEAKDYKYSIETQVKDLLSKLKDSSSGSIRIKDQENTAIFLSGAGKTVQAIFDHDYYDMGGNLFNKLALEHDLDLDKYDSLTDGLNRTDSSVDAYMASGRIVDKDKVFNYNDRTAYFRVDVNPFGFKFQEYADSLKTNTSVKFDQIKLTDVLPADWSLVPLDGEAMFAVYEASPYSFFNRKYDISFGGADREVLTMGLKAKRRLSSAEIADLLTFDPATLSWQFKTNLDKTYMIVYKAQLSEEAFNKLVEGKSQGDKAEIYTNDIEVSNVGELITHINERVKVTPELLSKAKPEWSGDSSKGENVLTWTINFTPYEKHYTNVKLKDTLDQNLSVAVAEDGNIDLSKISIRKSNQLGADGKYLADSYTDVELVTKASKDKPNAVVVSYDKTDHSLNFALPDSPAASTPYGYEIKYSTPLTPVDLQATEIRNTVKMTSEQVSPAAEGIYVESLADNKAWASLKSMPFFIFTKTELGQDDKALAGAGFTLYKDGVELAKYVTNAQGKLYLFNLADGSYSLKETKAPEGYALRNDEIKFTVKDKKLSLADSNAEDIKGLGKFDNPVLIPNETTVTEPSESSESTSTEANSNETTSTKPSASTTETEPAKSSASSQTTSPAESSTAQGTVKTGEKLSFAAPVIILAALVLLVVLVIKKRKNEVA